MASNVINGSASICFALARKQEEEGKALARADINTKAQKGFILQFVLGNHKSCCSLLHVLNAERGVKGLAVHCPPRLATTSFVTKDLLAIEADICSLVRDKELWDNAQR